MKKSAGRDSRGFCSFIGAWLTCRKHSARKETLDDHWPKSDDQAFCWRVFMIAVRVVRKTATNPAEWLRKVG